MSQAGIGLGVSLSALRTITNELQKYTEENPAIVEIPGKKPISVSWEKMETMHVCAFLIQPITKPHNCSLAQLWEKQGNLVPCEKTNTKQVKATNPPTHFVSHAWHYIFKDLVAAIEDYVRDEETIKQNSQAGEDMFFWLDTFAVDQNNSLEHEQQWWKDTFQTAIGRIGKTILVLQPWDNPLCLTRSWCLWEIFSTKLCGGKLHIRMSPNERDRFAVALQQQFQNVLKALTEIDVRRSKAGRAADQLAIYNNVKEGVGFEELNEMIKTKLRSWLCKEAQEALQAMPENSFEEKKNRVRLEIQLGSLLCELDQRDRSYDILSNALQVLHDMVWSATTAQKTHNLQHVTDFWWARIPESTEKDLKDLIFLCATEFAVVLTKRRNVQEALETLKKLLPLLEEEAKKDQSKETLLMRLLLVYAKLLQEDNKYEEAERQFLRLIELGEKHPEEGARGVIFYARYLRHRGKLTEALEYNNKAEIMIREQSQILEKSNSSSSTNNNNNNNNSFSNNSSSNNPSSNNPSNNSASNNSSSNNPSFSQSASIWLECWATKATTLKNLARANKDNKAEHDRFNDEALDLFRKVYQKQKEVLGKTHLDTIKSLHDLGKMLLELGFLEPAAQRCEQALSYLEARTTALTPLHFNASETASTVFHNESTGDDAANLSTEIALSLAKILKDSGRYKEALEKINFVSRAYERLYPTTSETSDPHVYNALSERAHILLLMGNENENPKQMLKEAMDGFLRCGLTIQHQWIKKVKNYQKTEVSQSLALSSRDCRAIIVDCGTNESKAMLCKFENNCLSTSEVGAALPPMLEFLKEKRALFAEEMNKRATDQNVHVTHIGMTAWYRAASNEDKEMTQTVIEIANEYAVKWTVRQVHVSHLDEGRFEAIAVNFAANRCGLPPTDILLGSGGGSVQISSNISNPDEIVLMGIEMGFKKGQQILMEKGIEALEEVKSMWAKHTAETLQQNPDFKIKAQGNAIGISACYHAATAAEIQNKELLCSEVLQSFSQRLESTVKKIADSGEKPDKASAMEVANLIVQISIFSNFVSNDTIVRFRRNWTVDGNELRTTWTTGWFIQNYLSN